MPGDQQRNVKSPELSPQGILLHILYWYVHTEVYALIYVPYGQQGEFLFCDKAHHFCYQRYCTSSRSVSIHQCLCSGASCVHRRSRGDKR